MQCSVSINICNNTRCKLDICIIPWFVLVNSLFKYWRDIYLQMHQFGFAEWVDRCMIDAMLLILVNRHNAQFHLRFSRTLIAKLLFTLLFDLCLSTVYSNIAKASIHKCISLVSLSKLTGMWLNSWFHLRFATIIITNLLCDSCLWAVFPNVIKISIHKCISLASLSESIDVWS